MPIRILVIGADGSVGRGLVKFFQEQGDKVLATTRRPETVDELHFLLNLAADPIEWPILQQVDAVIYCAGVVGFASCLSDPVGSARINTAAPSEIVEIFGTADTRFVYLSTNAVFDGSKPFVPHDAPTCPLTEYGRQKAKAEALILSKKPDAVVIRFSKILTPELASLLTWQRKLRAGEKIHPYSDVFRSPITRQFAIRIISEVMNSRIGGVFHASGDEDIAIDEYARILAHKMGADPSLIVPILSAKENPLPEDLSPHTTLDMTREKEEFGLSVPSSRAAIEWAVGKINGRF